MPKILVLYYSRTGNTEKMAKAVAEGASAVQGAEVELNYYVTPESLSSSTQYQWEPQPIIMK
jgi:NAD(P)H dehydrogenase (quinone)